MPLYEWQFVFDQSLARQKSSRADGGWSSMLDWQRILLQADSPTVPTWKRFKRNRFLSSASLRTPQFYLLTRWRVLRYFVTWNLKCMLFCDAILLHSAPDLSLPSRLMKIICICSVLLTTPSINLSLVWFGYVVDKLALWWWPAEVWFASIRILRVTESPTIDHNLVVIC